MKMFLNEPLTQLCVWMEQIYKNSPLFYADI